MHPTLATKTTRVLHRKSKMVSFRVSIEDYERLRIYCISKGQRSVSDLARLAVGTVVENGESPSLETRIAEMEGRVHLLTNEVLRVAGVGAGSPQTQIALGAGQAMSQ